MLYAREVMDLMGSFPGREFRKGAIVRYILGAKVDRRKYKAASMAVGRVLVQLVESGAVEHLKADGNGTSARYRWRAEVQQRA